MAYKPIEPPKVFANPYSTHSPPRRKLTPNVTPNTLESMIEYTLISSILDRIYKMTKKMLDDTKLYPLWHLLKIRTWGIKWKRVIDKIDEWVAW
jgi:hypothetical protein